MSDAGKRGDLAIEHHSDGTVTIRVPTYGLREALVGALLLFCGVAAGSRLVGAVLSGEVDRTVDWLVLGGTLIVITAVVWPIWRLYTARVQITAEGVVIRNLWRTYRVQREDVQGLSVGSNAWLIRVGVISTRSGKRIRSWALTLGYPDERSKDELKAEREPVAPSSESCFGREATEIDQFRAAQDPCPSLGPQRLAERHFCSSPSGSFSGSWTSMAQRTKWSVSP